MAWAASCMLVTGFATRGMYGGIASPCVFRQEFGAALNCLVSSGGQWSTGSFRPRYAGFTRIVYGPSWSGFPLRKAIAFGSEAMYDVRLNMTCELVEVDSSVAAATDERNTHRSS